MPAGDRRGSLPTSKSAGSSIGGIADKYRGERVKANIVLKPGETATAEEIIAFCREKLAAYKVPKLAEFWTFLPKSVIG